MEYGKPEVIIDFQELLDLKKRIGIDGQNIELIKKSFEVLLATFANVKSKIPDVKIRKLLEEQGISLDIKIRGDKKENIGIEDLLYTLNYK